MRIHAIRQAARSGGDEALPYLVDRLSDTESDVRLFAILALQDITGKTMGYRHYDPPDRRIEAIQRWREWLTGRDGPEATTQPQESVTP